MGSKVIGIDVGGTNIKGVLLSAEGRILREGRVSTGAALGRRGVLRNLFELTDTFLASHGVAGIGVGTPGFEVKGKLMGAPNMPGWAGTPLAALLRRRYGLPAHVLNDVSAAALGEARYGAARGIRNAVMLAVGTGIGGGLVLNGRSYLGSSGMAGEAGHLIVVPGGRRCSCGRRGCLEIYAGALGILKTARNLRRSAAGRRSPLFSPGEALTVKRIYHFVRRGDRAALAIHRASCRHLAMGVGALINILSPDKFILGGGVLLAGDVILREVRRHLPEFTLPELLARCRLVRATLGDRAGAVGAAAFALEKSKGARFVHQD